MTILYAIIKKNGKIIDHEKCKSIFKNYDVAKKVFIDHALKWLKLVETSRDSHDEWVKNAPMLMRLSDRAVLCSTADVIPDIINAYKEFLEKTKSTQLQTEYDAGMKCIVAKMMNQYADVPMETSNHASYAIVDKVDWVFEDGGLAVCESSKNILCNTLESLKKEYADLALTWGKREVVHKVNSPAPILMRLSDGAALYSVTDFLPEMNALYNDYIDKLLDDDENKLYLMQHDFNVKMKTLVDSLIEYADHNYALNI